MSATKVALLGIGHWGRNIARCLQELGALGAICELRADHPNLEPYRGRVPICHDPREVLADEGLPAVAIATPAATHHELARRALEAGKDVFVEKPLALTAREGEQLVELAERRGRILMVGHLLQYHPAVLRLRELVQGGELGKVQYIYSNRLNIGRLRTEESILWSLDRKSVV